ncbi:MAG: T9SS type A sorting domain-containing protein, partial [Sphingobacteriaceae bacterium]
SSAISRIGGTGGVVIGTINGGANWKYLNTPTTSDIYRLDFTSANTGVIVGENDLVMKTTDGGANWADITPTDISMLYTAVNMISSSTIWIGTAGGDILKTTDGGNNWTLQTTNTSEIILDIQFTDADHGFAAASGGILLRTSDGGDNWSAFKVGTLTNNYFNVNFLDENEGWVTGSAGMILYTKNGGNNWSIQQVPQGISTRNLIGMTQVGTTTFVVGTTGTILQSNPTSLELETPNGGETIQGGDSYDITWNSENVTTIKIEYSTNGGTSWNTIAGNITAANKTYTWNVPNIATKIASVRITDVADASVTDESDANFEIEMVKEVMITQPNGGERINMGSTTNITWDSKNIDKINIYYSVNGGLTWASIASNIAASAQTYSWSVPNVPSATAKVKIEAAEDNTVSDESDQYFTVVDATGIEEIAQNTFSLYPNPSNGAFSLQLSESLKPFTLTVTTISGKIIYTQNVSAQSNTVKILLPDNIAAGLYFVNLKNNDANVTEKFTVTK